MTEYDGKILVESRDWDAKDDRIRALETGLRRMVGMVDRLNETRTTPDLSQHKAYIEAEYLLAAADGGGEHGG